MSLTLVLIAHGTVTDLDDLPAFVAEIRHGRPAPADLLAELRARYEHVGGSPLLDLTQALARAVEAHTGLPTRVAMRLWEPRIEVVLADLTPADTVCLVPLAPFSTAVYEAAARKSLARLTAPPRLLCVSNWGESPGLVEAWAARIAELDVEHGRSERAVILSAHSLPLFVIQQGDSYAREFEASARAIEASLGRPCTIAYQSQGAMDGAWLGPTLLDAFRAAQGQGSREVLVAPVGFLAEHIETLYDLDVEAKAQARELGLGFSRVAALDAAPALVQTIGQLVQQATALWRD